MKSLNNLQLYFRCGISLFCIIGLFGFSSAVLSQETDDDQTISDDPQDCAECHIDVTLDWETSDHAQTFHTDAFQSAINNGADASTCYQCHTTDYTPFNGEYTHEGVSCESCHGQTPATHPDEPFAVAPGLDMCAECHITTYNEWQVSAHGLTEMPCTSCHDPHAQALRFDTTQDLCLNCHVDDDLSSYVHVSHEAESCSDCHWHRGTFDTTTHLISGELSPSGHEGLVETLACVTCHEDLEDTVAVAPAESIPPLEMRVALQELEVEVANVRAQGENVSAVRLVQGLVVGVVAGIILSFLLSRLRPGQRVEENYDDN